MSSPLDKCHPFRKTISHDAPAQAAAQSSDGAAHAPGFSAGRNAHGSGGDEEEGFSLKLKLRIAAGVLAMSAVWFVSANFEYLFLGSSGESALEKEERELSKSPEVNDDWAYQGNAEEHAEGPREVGIFAQLFCRGAKRSALCD